LVDSRYGTWDWNFGKSPQYNLANAIRITGGTIEFYLDVANGIITSLRVFGDFFASRNLKELEQCFSGISHNRESVREAFEKAAYKDFFGEADLNELIDAMF